MDSVIHHFHDLFAQLGLPNRPRDIYQFIASHANLSREIKLPDAAFWTPAQSAFLRESVEQDSDWAELVDQLDEALRSDAGAH